MVETKSCECVFDREALTSRCLGNETLVERVLQKFTVQLESDVAKLARALEAGDWNEFSLVAHRIKGMAANVEARELSRTAALAENTVSSGNQAGLAECLA